MTISDSSTNGSLVRVASQEQSETLPTSGEIHADLGSRALQGAEVALKETKEQQPVQDNYVNLAAAANKLSQGNIEPSILIGQMKRILETMPDEEREALGDIRMLVDSVVDEHGRQIDRYRTGSVARQIETAVRQRMQQR